MIELYPNVSERARTDAEIAWNFAKRLDPVAATNFLNRYTEAALAGEEQEFLKFYFNLQMETLKNG